MRVAPCLLNGRKQGLGAAVLAWCKLVEPSIPPHGPAKYPKLSAIGAPKRDKVYAPRRVRKMARRAAR